MGKETIVYVRMLLYMPCHHMFIYYANYSITKYLSITQYILSCYYLLQVCHIMYAICYMYVMSRNSHCHMLCHVMKYYLLHVCHVMKCCLLYLCPKVCHDFRLSFTSRYATSRLLSFYIHVISSRI